MVLGACVAALAMSGSAAATAAPVEVQDRRTLWLVTSACATWVDSVIEDGDLVGYEQTEVCGHVQDRDGDNAIGAGDSSYATIWQAHCGSPEPFRQCGDASTEQWEVTAAEMAIHMPNGTAALHSTAPSGCRVDLDWTGDEPTGQSSSGPDTIEHSSDPTSVVLHQRYSGESRRAASVSGTACVSPAGVTPSGSMREEYYGDRYIGVTVDPAA